MPSPVNHPQDSAPQPPIYFNKAQLNDVKEGEDLAKVAANPRHAANLVKKGLTDERMAALVEICKKARKKTTETGQARSDRRAATLNTTGKQRTLLNGPPRPQCSRTGPHDAESRHLQQREG